MLLLYTAITAFFVTFIVMPILIQVLVTRKMMDMGGGRKIHKGFVPSMGGAAIAFGFFVALLVWLLPPTNIGEGIMGVRQYYFLCGALVITVLTGLRDDLIPLSPKGKLALLLLAAFMVTWGGGSYGIRITSFYGFMGIHELPLVFSYGITVFAIIVITNAFNLIDGLDGLAGTIALIAFSLLAAWFYLVGDNENHGVLFALILVALIGGILGFLCYNWHPASIFMGDTGSLFLGFALSVGVIKFIEVNGAASFVSDFKIGAPISMGAAIAILPLLDTGRIFILRISQGRSPFSPDKLHIHHLLMRMGLKHPQVALVMGAVYLLFIMLIFFLSHYLSDNVLVPIIIIMCVGFHFVLRDVINIVFRFKRKTGDHKDEEHEQLPSEASDSQ